MDMDIEQILSVDLSGRTTVDTAENCPIWKWVKRHASFVHVDNNEAVGVYEFIVHRSDLCETNTKDLPSALKDVAQKLMTCPEVNYAVFYV